MAEQFPRNAKIQELKNSLKKKAEELFNEAEKLSKSSDKKEFGSAQEKYQQAEELWPTLAAFDEKRLAIRRKYPVLAVGVRQLPQFMSPQTALTDSELRAVEILFESLVKFSPDASGMGRYHPGLAVGRPQVIELGRQFQLPPNAFWWDGKKETELDVNDVRATFRPQARRWARSLAGLGKPLCRQRN